MPNGAAGLVGTITSSNPSHAVAERKLVWWACSVPWVWLVLLLRAARAQQTVKDEGKEGKAARCDEVVKLVVLTFACLLVGSAGASVARHSMRGAMTYTCGSCFPHRHTARLLVGTRKPPVRTSPVPLPSTRPSKAPHAPARHARPPPCPA